MENYLPGPSETTRYKFMSLLSISKWDCLLGSSIDTTKFGYANISSLQWWGKIHKIIWKLPGSYLCHSNYTEIVIVHTRQGVQITHQNMVMQTLAIGYDGEMFARAFGNYQVQSLLMEMLYFKAVLCEGMNIFCHRNKHWRVR